MRAKKEHYFPQESAKQKNYFPQESGIFRKNQGFSARIKDFPQELISRQFPADFPRISRRFPADFPPISRPRFDPTRPPGPSPHTASQTLAGVGPKPDEFRSNKVARGILDQNFSGRYSIKAHLEVLEEPSSKGSGLKPFGRI